jgi:magnesium transporter
MVSIFYWKKTDRAVKSLEATVLQEPREKWLAAEDVLWVDLHDATPEEEELVFRHFLPIHSLSQEDVTKPRREPDAHPHFPKVEEFPDYLFIIVNPLSEEYLAAIQHQPANGFQYPERAVTQLSAVLTENILVTHHYQSLTAVRELKNFLSKHGARCERGPDYLFHLILDAAVDEFVPVLDHFDQSLDDIELRIVRRPTAHMFQALLRMKRQIILLRKTLVYQREVLARLARGEFALLNERETVYYRNVYDHLVRFTELIESSRDMVSDLMQTHLAATGNRLNQIVKVLTMISTIILPMTLIVGVYGMNFDKSEWPDFDSTWGFPFALGLMTLTGIVSLAFFKWRKWF